MTKILDIEGIGPVFQKKLIDAGVRTTNKLLQVAATKKGRGDLAGLTGITETLILEWVNLADLMRVKGVGSEYSDLLEEAGVDTVKELRNRKPENLFKSMVETNQKKKLVRRTPSLKEVTRWVKEAKELPPVVKY
jgi:predicted flap endonuclease-1-like 5' DNA nuclease